MGIFEKNTDIILKSISKKYGRKQALTDINVTFRHGKITGLLGSSGAGKTTLLNIAVGRIKPNAGSVILNDDNIFENEDSMSRIYMTSEENMFPSGYNIAKLINITESFYPEFDRAYALELLDEFELNTKAKWNKLSSDQNTILKQILCLASNAEIMVFDEPILDSDEGNREGFYKQLLKKYDERNNTVIISTHNIKEIDHIIEDVVIIDKGNILLSDNLQHFLSSGYTVTGQSEYVDKYLEGKEVLGSIMIGSVKSASIIGSLDREFQDMEKINVDYMKLQDLFIEITKHEEEKTDEK